MQDGVLLEVYARGAALLATLLRGVPRSQLLEQRYQLRQGPVVLCEAGRLRIQPLLYRRLHALHRRSHCT